MNLVVADRKLYAYTGSRPWVAGHPLVVFLHGAAQDHSVWALQSRYIAHHGCNVLAIDLPGHGRSGGAGLESVEEMANLLSRLIEDMQAPAATLIGHSMGALAVLECAARAPERVSRIALVGPAVPMEVSAELLQAAHEDEALAYSLINGWSFGPLAHIGGNEWPGVWMSGNGLRLLERNAKGVLERDLLACRNYLGGLAAAAKVHCPALLVMGSRDVMAPPRNARSLIDALAAPETLVLEATGHAIMAERPGALLDALRRFLALG
ncbi:MAG: alpha/beta hydrolase [Pseudomonadota bacterium]|nr:alpha/beta hydrolase [Pseudomonadota bacterium]